jgi:filamentous hemagglutinin family protein
MKAIRRISKKYYLRQIVACWSICAMLLAFSPARVAMAVPNGGVCTYGGATIDAISNPLGVTVTINGMQTIIHWDSLNTTQNEFLTFLHNGYINGAVLNRVVGAGGTTIFDGMLNGEQLRIFMINPAGIVFGRHAQINVAQLVASSLDIADSDFLNGAPYEFINGSTAGDVIFNAKDENVNAERLFLIGKYVRNKGGLVAGDYVVMAAGNRVIISEPDSSVAVEVKMDGFDPADFKVVNKHHYGGDSTYGGVVGNVDTQLEADHVILAAGDVWSQAISNVKTVDIYAEGPIEADDLDSIHASAGPGSNAVSSVSIKSGSDITIDDDVTATANGQGTANNAIATISITSTGGNVDIGNHKDVEIEATAKDAVLNNTAKVDITAAGDVSIVAEESDTKVIAEAYYGDCIRTLSNKANVNINAGGDVIVKADGGERGGCGGCGGGFTPHHALVEAEAKDALNSNDAGVDIIADDDVKVMAFNGGKAEVEAKAITSAENTATVKINAGDDVKVIAKCEGQPSEAEIMALAKGADGPKTNTALVDITAGGDVKVIAKDGGKAEIEAIAEDGPTNKADVLIDAGGDVIVKAEGGQIDKEWVTVIDSYNINIKHKVEIPDTYDIHLRKYDCRHNCTAVIHNFPNSDPTDAELLANNYDPKDWYVEYVHCNHDGHTEWEHTTITTPTLEIPGDYPGWEYDYDCHGKYYTVNKHDELHTSFEGPSVASIKAKAEDDLQSNTANILITAGDDVKVMAFDGGKAEMVAEAEHGVLNTSDVTINSKGDVKVIAKGYTETTDSPKATSDALIKAKAKDGEENTATVNIDAVGGDVLVLGKNGGDAAINAWAKEASGLQTNTAKVNITATEVEYTKMVEDKEVVCTKGGNVVVKAEGCRSDAEIEAKAEEGQTNNADILICIDGKLKVKGEEGGDAKVEAKAQEGKTNNATVNIGAGQGIEVMALGQHSDASIAAKAEKGYTNTAYLNACTGGDLLVMALNGGDAEIATEAKRGKITDAQTYVQAVGNIVVAAADFGGQFGGDSQSPTRGGCGSTSAKISAAAESKEGCPENPTTSNAEVHVTSHEGGVVVAAIGSCRGPDVEAGITSEATGATSNNAYTGVAAGKGLSSVVDWSEYNWQEFQCSDIPELLAGSVIVGAYKRSAEAKISSLAAGGEKNTAKTVICAPGEVVVAGIKGGKAKVFSGAFGCEADNKAETKVFGKGIALIGKAHLMAKTPTAEVDITPTPDDGWVKCITTGGKVVYMDPEGDESSMVMIGDYASREDCPECPPCPCEKPGVLPVSAAAPAPEVPAPIAPLPPYFIPRVEGCPELTQAAATELGIPAETLQVGLGDALALNPNLQPCRACASLLNAASILRDVDGSRMAAMLQVFNSMAPADAPYTPEMATSIATAFENAAEGSQYASAMEFVDAFVQYATALDAMGSPVGDSTAFVMGKYGQGLSQNGNMATFVAGRIEGGQTF